MMQKFSVTKITQNIFINFLLEPELDRRFVLENLISILLVTKSP